MFWSTGTLSLGSLVDWPDEALYPPSMVARPQLGDYDSIEACRQTDNVPGQLRLVLVLVLVLFRIKGHLANYQSWSWRIHISTDSIYM